MSQETKGNDITNTMEQQLEGTNDEQPCSVELSKENHEQLWMNMQQYFVSQDTFEVTVTDVVKSGVVANIGIRAFIPASMLERHFVEDFSSYKGRTLRVKVKEMDRENNKLILSPKAVLEAEFEMNKAQVLQNLTVGQQLEGTVQRLTKFGVFVDIGGGVEGMIHVSELCWEHVNQPADVVSEGQKVKVKVLKIDHTNGKVSLSMKSTQPDPWEQAATWIKTDAILSGTVKRLVDFGAFVEIAPHVEGLIHVSQIAHRHVATPHEVLKEGQEVKVKVLAFHPTEKRVSLSMKEIEETTSAPKVNKRKKKVEEKHADVSLNQHQAMNITLAERFGDMLNKFKQQ